MPKYKISKSNLKEFFSWLTKKTPPKDIQAIIDADPEIKKLRDKIQAIDKKYEKGGDPRFSAAMKRYGL